MKKKWIIVFGVVLAVLVLGVFLANGNKGLEANVLQVEPRPIAQSFTEEGEVAAEVQLSVYAAYGGKVVALPVTEGQQVNKGDLLLTLDSRELKLQAEQLEAQLKSLAGEELQAYRKPYESTVRQQELQVEQAERDLRVAQTNLERVSELYQAGVTTETEYEAARNAVEGATTMLQQQKEALTSLNESSDPTGGLKTYYTGRKEALTAQIELLNYQIDNAKIVSPITGVIANNSIKTGQIINPGLQVMTIFQKDAYQVEAYVRTEDVQYVKTGMPVELIQETKGEDISLTGTVKQIAPVAVPKLSALGLEEKRVKVTINPEIPGTLELRPGYSLDVNFTIAQQQDKLVVPKTALFPYADNEALWVVREGKAEIQPVTKGFQNDRFVAIEQGLKPGDLVILNPQLKGLEKDRKIVVSK